MKFALKIETHEIEIPPDLTEIIKIILIIISNDFIKLNK